MPQSKPMTTGRGTDLAVAEKDTPATKTMASMPSRSTVMKGSINMAYFSAKCFSRPVLLPPVLTGPSIAAAIFPRHFSCILPMRRSAAPTMVMMTDATSAKAPSYAAAPLAHLSEPRV